MATFNRLEVYKQMASTGLVPVFYHPDINTCKKVLKACHQGGIRAFEFTNRGDFAHEIFAELVKFAKRELPDIILGAGTVMDAPTATLYIQNGANFIVAPVVKADVATVCHRRKIAWIPGAATLTEISNAEELGAEIVKVFPGNILGPTFIKGLKGPMPWTSIMVTGGVEATEENLKGWFNAGVTCVGIGSTLFTKSLVEGDDTSSLVEKIRNAIQIVKRINN